MTNLCDGAKFYLCYVDLIVNITKLPNYAKIKQTSDLATAILGEGVDFENGRKELTLGKSGGSNLIFRSDKSRRDQHIEDVEFFDIENKKPKNVRIYSACQDLKDNGLKFLTTDQNSPIKSYRVKLWFKVFNQIFKGHKGKFYRAMHKKIR